MLRTVNIPFEVCILSQGANSATVNPRPTRFDTSTQHDAWRFIKYVLVLEPFDTAIYIAN